MWMLFDIRGTDPPGAPERVNRRHDAPPGGFPANVNLTFAWIMVLLP